jgi:hypothetical protein
MHLLATARQVRQQVTFRYSHYFTFHIEKACIALTISLSLSVRGIAFCKELQKNYSFHFLELRSREVNEQDQGRAEACDETADKPVSPLSSPKKGKLSIRCGAIDVMPHINPTPPRSRADSKPKRLLAEAWEVAHQAETFEAPPRSSFSVSRVYGLRWYVCSIRSTYTCRSAHPLLSRFLRLTLSFLLPQALSTTTTNG